MSRPTIEVPRELLEWLAEAVEDHEIPELQGDKMRAELQGNPPLDTPESRSLEEAESRLTTVRELLQENGDE